MIEEFTITKGWKIFLVFAGTLIGGAGLGCVLFSAHSNGKWFLIMMGIALFILAVAALFNSFKAKVIITDYDITSISLLGSKTLTLEEIKGFRLVHNKIIIFPLSDVNKKIVISYQYLTNKQRLESWIVTRMINLDQKEYHEELQEILHIQDSGDSINNNVAYLDKIKKLCSCMNYLGLAIGLWLIFYPSPYFISVTLGLLYPFLILGIFSRYSDIITFGERKTSAYPSLSTALIMPSLGLTLRAVLDFELLNYQACLKPCFIVLICLAAVIYF